MIHLNRRSILKVSLACAASAALPAQTAQSPHSNRIHQSVARWCYKQIPLPQLCEAAVSMGLKGIDLLQPDEYEIPRRYGLLCTMGYAGAGDISKGLNRIENHSSIEASLRQNIPLAVKAGVTNLITFSGLRDGLSDEVGAHNSVAGLRRLKSLVEDHGIILCVELLNSKVDHPGYMCDHTAWGVRVLEEVDSSNIKLLYDVYHMQIMEGDLIATIRANSKWIGHYHTGGVPGRHELNDHQEINWPGVMRAIADTGFRGYVAHEFVPTADPLTSLRQAVELCNV
jgi:hydroxypyruvate isomerase